MSVLVDVLTVVQVGLCAAQLVLSRALVRHITIRIGKAPDGATTTPTQLGVNGSTSLGLATALVRNCQHSGTSYYSEWCEECSRVIAEYEIRGLCPPEFGQKK